MTSPNWGEQVTPNPSIHTPPTEVPGANLPDQTQLLSWGAKFIDGIVKQVVLAIVGVVVPGPVVAQLANWAQTLLPAQILAPIQQLVDLLVALLGPIPVVGTVIQTLADYFGLLHDDTTVAQETGESAQYSADVANAGVALLNAQLAGGGTVFTDTFNRAADTNLGADYDRSMSSGSGTWGTDGTGDVKWTIGGSTNQNCHDRVTVALTTKTQAIATVLTNPPGAGQFGDNSKIRLALRENAARTTYVVATIDAGFVEIGYVNSSTYTRIGSTQSVSQSNGDLWEFRAGCVDPTTLVYDDYRFELLQNNLTVCARVDGGHSSQAGSSPATWVGTYDYGALLANAGTVQFGFFTFQLAAPTIQVLTVADRTP